MKIYLPITLALLLFVSMGTVQGSIDSKLTELEGLINQLDMDQNAKDMFAEYIAGIRSAAKSAHFATVGHLSDGVLVELVAMLLEGDIAFSSQHPMEEEDEFFMEEIADVVDQILAEELFFKVNKDDLVFLPSEFYYVGSLSCSIRIFVRGLGPVMFDPGGILYVGFGDAVEMMAVPVEEFEGATFTWEWDEGNDNDFYSQGNRAYFRAGEYETSNVRVTFNTGMGTQCQAVLRVIMQDGFAMLDLGEM